MRFPQEAIAAAAFAFEAARGNELGEFEETKIAKYGLTNVDPDVIARELIPSVRDESKSDSAYRQQAYWALGKKFDASLLPFFTEALRLEVERDLDATYQIMIALDNLGEPVFSAARPG